MLNEKCKMTEVDIFLKYGNPNYVFHFTHCEECKKKIYYIQPILMDLKEKTKKVLQKVSY